MKYLEKYLNKLCRSAGTSTVGSVRERMARIGHRCATKREARQILTDMFIKEHGVSPTIPQGQKRGPSRPAPPPRSKPIKIDFYKTPEWRALRYQALKASDGKCVLCGRSAKDGIVLHVDHIKPRSKFPRLQLELSNLQVLCEDDNLGKSNKDQTDWR